ncbi:MAG: TetR/AcrR family transcriptional regulator [Gammaproteobacteria bacterium]|jgi:AcrR family transcriptional regulator
MAAPRSLPPDRITRQKIIDSALKLYAQNGIDGVPVRALTTDAGVNVAAVHYHFGSTEALAEAVFGELSERLNAQRVMALEAITAGAAQAARKPAVSAIVRAFVAPYVGPEASTEGRLLAQLILKHRLSPSPMTERVVGKHFDPMAKKFVAALLQALPEVPPGVMAMRYMLMVSTVVLSLSDRGRAQRLQRLAGKKAASEDLQTMEATLVDFIVGGLRAPVSGP